MSVYYRIGDLLEQKDTNVILQICNSKNCFGAGLALAIKNKYPEAFEADSTAAKNGENTLGEFSFVPTKDGKLIFNLYAMKGLGTNQRQLDYEAFYSLLERVKNIFDEEKVKEDNLTIGIPYKIGSALAGGSWPVIESMIFDVFGDSDLKVVICVLPQFKKEINWVNVNVESEDTYYK